MGITSANTRVENLAVVEAAKQYAEKPLISGQIIIDWMACGVQMRQAPVKCLICF